MKVNNLKYMYTSFTFLQLDYIYIKENIEFYVHTY